MHELGHAADFYAYGGRYRLVNHKLEVERSADAAVKEHLQAINKEPDPELRADALGELLILGPETPSQQLCYTPVFTIQTLTDANAVCSGDGLGAALMKHYTHPPLQGKALRL